MTGQQERFLQAVVALAPAEVLRLVARAASEAGGDAPMVTVHLVGGHVLVGAVVRVGAQRGSESVVLADRQTGRLGFALLETVTAVELHHPHLFRDVLTEGRIPPESQDPPVSVLALKREFAPTAEFPVHADWDVVAGSEQLLLNLAKVLRSLREVASQVRADEIGRDAWSGVHLMRVVHEPGSALSAQRTGDELTVHADLGAALPRNLHQELHREINTLL